MFKFSVLVLEQGNWVVGLEAIGSQISPCHMDRFAARGVKIRQHCTPRSQSLPRSPSKYIIKSITVIYGHRLGTSGQAICLATHDPPIGGSMAGYVNTGE